jgi:hypothetical protein
MHGLEDSKEFEVFCDDGITIAGKPMLIHQKLFKSFLLFSNGRNYGKEKAPLKMR